MVMNPFSMLGGNKSKHDSYDEEFSTEMYEDIFNNENTAEYYGPYSDRGIRLNESANPLRFLYSGILAQNGADDIYVVLGYGDSSNWESVEYHKMQKVGPQAFEVLLPIKRPGTINIALKDSANNWDNNSYQNYVFSNNFYGNSH